MPAQNRRYLYGENKAREAMNASNADFLFVAYNEFPQAVESFEMFTMADGKIEYLQRRLVPVCIVTKQGERIYEMMQVIDIPNTSGQNWTVLVSGDNCEEGKPLVNSTDNHRLISGGNVVYSKNYVAAPFPVFSYSYTSEGDFVVNKLSPGVNVVIINHETGYADFMQTNDKGTGGLVIDKYGNHKSIALTPGNLNPASTTFIPAYTTTADKFVDVEKTMYPILLSNRRQTIDSFHNMFKHLF